MIQTLDFFHRNEDLYSWIKYCCIDANRLLLVKMAKSENHSIQKRKAKEELEIVYTECNGLGRAFLSRKAHSDFRCVCNNKQIFKNLLKISVEIIFYEIWLYIFIIHTEN